MRSRVAAHLREEEAHRLNLRRHDEEHDAGEKQPAAHLDHLPPEARRLVLAVKESGGPRQSIRRLGLQRVVASGEERREEDQGADRPEDDEADGEILDGLVILGAALDARVLPHVGDLLQRLVRRRDGVGLLAEQCED